MDNVKVSIIGAGVIGLAIAEALSQKIDGDIVVFEMHDSFGQETSSRNSEVIHAGIYYPKDSLKSLLCLQGNKLLYQFCAENGVKHKKCGKIIISTNEAEAKKIESIYNNAVSVGVPDLRLLTKEDVLALEPNVFALNGIFSGSTGIIDSHGLMDCLNKKAEKNGVMFAFGSETKEIKKQGDGYVLTDQNGESIQSEWVINCAGLNADKMAQLAGFDIDKLGYRLYYCKGDYFGVTGSKGKLNHLVYPVPHEQGHGLGVHATLDLDGYIRLGPDTEYVEKIYYDVDPAKRKDFYQAVKTYLPWVDEAMLAPDTAGMRPKLQGPNDGFRDFVIKEEKENGCPRFINLIGIESPGLTSCLAIGKYLENLVK
ncbi:MAG: NAD(P)/FAD-dependent oxidoreductase [bacterium]